MKIAVHQTLKYDYSFFVDRIQGRTLAAAALPEVPADKSSTAPPLPEPGP